MPNTPHLKIPHVTDEEQKSIGVNEQSDRFDEALNQKLPVTATVGTDAEVTITAAQLQRNTLLYITGSPGEPFTLQLPNDDGIGGPGAERRFSVYNATPSVMTVNQAGLTAVVQGNSGAELHTDGTDVLSLSGASGGAISTLSDVDIAFTDLQDGDVLVYNFSLGLWVPGEATINLSLQDLIDVDLAGTDLQDGDVLTYNEALDLWVPAETAEAGAANLGALSDVDLGGTDLQDQDTLVFDAALALWRPGEGGSGSEGPQGVQGIPGVAGAPFKGVRVTNSTVITLDAGVFESIPYDAVDYDVGGWLVETENDTITVPAGVTFVAVDVVVRMASGGGRTIMRINRNDEGMGTYENEGSSRSDGTISATFAVTAGDQIVIMLNNVSGVDTNGSGTSWTVTALEQTSIAANNRQDVMVYKSAEQVITTATWTTIFFEEVAFDAGDWFVDTENDALIVPAGVDRVFVTMTVRFTAVVTGECILRIKVEGAIGPGPGIDRHDASSTTDRVLSGYLEVSEGDRISAAVFQSAGGNRSLVGSQVTSFSAVSIPSVFGSVAGADGADGAAGAAGAPPAPFSGAMVSLLSGQNVPSGTGPYTELFWTNVDYDIGDWFVDTEAATFTVPVGVTRIKITCQVQWENAAADQGFLLIVVKNGDLSNSFVGRPFDVASGTSDEAIKQHISSPALETVAGDRWSIMVRNESAGAMDITSNTTWFAIEAVEQTAVAPETFKGARVYKTGSQALADGVGETVVWDEVAFDIGGWFADTENDVFTIPAGVNRVLVGATWQKGSDSADRALTQIRLDGVQVAKAEANSSGTSRSSSPISTLVEVSEGQQISLRINCIGAASSIEGNERATNFWIMSIPDNFGVGSTGASALAELTDVDLAGTDLQDGDVLVYDAALALWRPGEKADPFDVGIYIRGTPGDGDLILNYVFVRSADFPVDFVGSLANARVDATADAVFDIAKNGTNIGTCQFDDSTGVFQFEMAVEQHFVAGDEISITAPATADVTLADISITLKGTRVGS